MKSPLIDNFNGGYSFMSGIEPYSCGAIAMSGWEVVHVTLANSMPWHAGLHAIRGFLQQHELEPYSLCGVELRCPAPHTIEGFIEFNQRYRAVLEEWGLMVGSENPVARTNVAPLHDPPAETVLFGFSYTRPSDLNVATYVIAGGGELREGALSEENIVRTGETGPGAMLEKAARVVEIMQQRLEKLSADPALLSAIDVYTVHPLRDSLEHVVFKGIPVAKQRGIHWEVSRPPVENIEFEMDMRGVRQELVVELG